VRRPLALVLIVTSLAFAGDPPAPQETPRTAEVKALIERLGAADFKQREAAREGLLKIGQDAVPLLEAATKDQDVERAQGAKEVLALLRWKLPPLVEAAIGGSLEDYPSLPVEQRKAGLDKIAQNLQSAKILAPFCANVARFEPDAGLRMEGFELYMALTPEGDSVRDALVLEALDAEEPRDELHFARARLLLRLGRTDEALREARKATEIAKPDTRAFLFVADALLAGGRPADAVEWLDGLRAKAPEDPEVLVRLGEAYLVAGERQKGDELLAQVMKMASAANSRFDRRLLLRVAQAYMRVKRPDDARDAVQKAVASAPLDPDVDLTLAELDLALGRPTEALRRFLSEAKYFKADPERMKRVRAGLSQVFAALGVPDLSNDEDLIQDAARGRRLDLARELAARFLLGRGLVAEAVSCYRAAAALDPDSVELRIRLGDGLRRLGKDDEAKTAYEQARALAPKDERVAERLRGLALGTPIDGGRAPLLEKASDIEAWDRRFAASDLEREPEAAYANALPPLLSEGRVYVVVPGTLAVYALEAKTGATAWKTPLPRPDPPEGVAADRVGLEPAGLLVAPAAACMRVSPRRARERVPLIALLANEWVKRSSQSSFKKAAFEAVLVTWLDPRDGKIVGTEKLLDEPISSAAPPSGKGSRALFLAHASEEKTELLLLDLVAKKVRWAAPVPGVSGRPVFAGEKVVIPFQAGVAILDAEGSVERTVYEQAPSTEVTESGGTLWFGAGGSVRAAPLAGEGREVVQLPGSETAAGSLAVLESRVFVASRGGAVRAFAIEGGRELAAQPLQGNDRAAARALAVVGGKLFALNGSEDSYKDEAPALLALDPGDLSVLWRRPMDRPTAWSHGDGLVVACSGGARSARGFRVVGARPGAASIDARPRFLKELRAAADDALADDEAEVAVLIARRWVALKGGLSLVDTESLIFFARTLARSRRPEDAESILAVARARDTSSDADAKLEALRKELGLDKQKPKEK
jgi:tetratricopeptide (TPR) repeat protein